MLLLIALSMAGAPTLDSAPRPADAAVALSFNASATIIRGAGVGHGKEPPANAQPAHAATIEDAAGEPHPAIIYDFE